jgi:hypothetical protein
MLASAAFQRVPSMVGCMKSKGLSAGGLKVQWPKSAADFEKYISMQRKPGCAGRNCGGLLYKPTSISHMDIRFKFRFWVALKLIAHLAQALSIGE